MIKFSRKDVAGIFEIAGKDERMGFTMTAAQMRKYLAARGFRAISQRGSHVKMTNGTDTTIVPMQVGDLAPGTLRGILADAGLNVADAKKWSGKE